MKPIAIIVGTRPEIIKMSPIIEFCQNNSINFYLVHSNQHYSKELDQIFFKQLHVSPPDYSLNVGSGTHGEQTGKMLQKFEQIFLKNSPVFVLVQGDTNTTLAGALTAKKMNIPVGHIEAGLRSNDRKMPEEINRIITDHISDLCFVPTETQMKILLKEGITKSQIIITGNTIVDAVYRNLNFLDDNLIKSIKKEYGNYVLVTIHRAENVDEKSQLTEIFEAISEVGLRHNLEIIAPLHPRTVKMINEYKIDLHHNIHVFEPQGYFKFLSLLKNCKLVLTDSGGIQEEACILNVPCVTIRNNTERPETVEIGANVVAGLDRSKIIPAVNKMFKYNKRWDNPYGEGNSSEKIIKATLKFLQS